MPDTTGDFEGWITTAKAAQRLQLTQRRIRQLVRAGELEGYKVSRNLWLVKESAVTAYQTKKSQQGRA